MKDVLSDGGWLCSGGVCVFSGGGVVHVCVSERADARMLHVLDNPISPVISHTQ